MQSFRSVWYVTHSLKAALHTHLNTVWKADSHWGSEGFPAGTHRRCRCLLGAQCKCQRNIGIHGALLITLPCIIYIKLSPARRVHWAQVTNKQGSMEDRNQIFMPKPDYLRPRGRGVTWPQIEGSAGTTSFHAEAVEAVAPGEKYKDRGGRFFVAVWRST